MDVPARLSLLGLPVELRLRIFEYALQDVHLKLRHRLACCGHTIRNAWALLQISSVVRREVRLPFFETVTFEFRDGMTEAELQAWMDAIGPDAVSRLSKLSFVCRGKCYYDFLTLYANRFHEPKTSC